MDGQHHRGYGRTLVEGEGYWGSGEVEKKNPLWRPYLSRRSRKKKKKKKKKSSASPTRSLTMIGSFTFIGLLLV